MPIDFGSYSWWQPFIETLGTEIIFPDRRQVKGMLRDRETSIEVHADDWDHALTAGATLVVAGIPHTIVAIAPVSLRTRTLKVQIARRSTPTPRGR